MYCRQQLNPEVFDSLWLASAISFSGVLEVSAWKVDLLESMQ